MYIPRWPPWLRMWALHRRRNFLRDVVTQAERSLTHAIQQYSDERTDALTRIANIDAELFKMETARLNDQHRTTQHV